MCSAPHLVPAIYFLFPLCTFLQGESRESSGALSFVRAFGLVLVLNIRVALCSSWGPGGTRGASCPGAAGEEEDGVPAGRHLFSTSQPCMPETHNPLQRGAVL